MAASGPAPSIMPTILDAAAARKASVKELRAWLWWAEVDSSGCVEKDELVALVVAELAKPQPQQPEPDPAPAAAAASGAGTSAAAAAAAAAAGKPAGVSRAPTFLRPKSVLPRSMLNRPVSMAPAFRRTKSVSGSGRHRAAAVSEWASRLVDYITVSHGGDTSAGASGVDGHEHVALLRDLWVLVAEYYCLHEHEWGLTDTGVSVACQDEDDVSDSAIASTVAPLTTVAGDAADTLQLAEATHTAAALLDLTASFGREIQRFGEPDMDHAAANRVDALKAQKAWRRAWGAHPIGSVSLTWAVRIDELATNSVLLLGVALEAGAPRFGTTPLPRALRKYDTSALHKDDGDGDDDGAARDAVDENEWPAAGAWGLLSCNRSAEFGGAADEQIYAVGPVYESNESKTFGQKIAAGMCDRIGRPFGPAADRYGDAEDDDAKGGAAAGGGATSPMGSKAKAKPKPQPVVVGFQADLLTGDLRFWVNGKAVMELKSVPVAAGAAGAAGGTRFESAPVRLHIGTDRLPRCRPVVLAKTAEAQFTLVSWKPPAASA